jgi:hypothetical protein
VCCITRPSIQIECHIEATRDINLVIHHNHNHNTHTMPRISIQLVLFGLLAMRAAASISARSPINNLLLERAVCSFGTSCGTGCTTGECCDDTAGSLCPHLLACKIDADTGFDSLLRRGHDVHQYQRHNWLLPNGGDLRLCRILHRLL